MTGGPINQIAGSDKNSFEGVVYFPNSVLKVDWGGTAASANFTIWVALKYKLQGDANITINYDPSASSVPVPAGFMVGGIPRLLF